MKVELIKVDGQPVGWTITSENEGDNNTLNSMRDLQFFGFDDTAIKYAGRIDDGENVKTLRWIQVKHKNNKREE